MKFIISMKYDRSGFDDKDKIWLDLSGNKKTIRLNLEDFIHRRIERTVSGAVSKTQIKEIIEFLQEYLNSEEV